MRKGHGAAMLLVLALAARPARGDGLVYKLPKDGAWATYRMESTSSVQGNVRERVTNTIRIASVGKSTEEGLPCRWIEISGQATKESKDHGPKGKTRTRVSDEWLHKLLIPEKRLARGEPAVDYLVRGWVRRGAREPQRTDRGDPRLMGLDLVLHGGLSDAKALAKAEVASKRGKMMCEGVAGTLETEHPVVGKLSVTVEARLHADSPFGLVRGRYAFEMPLQRKVEGLEEGTVKVELVYTLTDYGTGAVSRMADRK